ncbi:MAG: AMP-binding protein, partial [Gammaproteobacteria bacterium]|nr:AMP-binding protein [Gammaproteobacteria bacterium]
MTELWTQFKQVAASNPAAPAIGNLTGVSSLNYSDVFYRVSQLADLLMRLDSSAIGLFADNSPSWVIADLACQLSKNCLVPLPTFFSPSQREHALNDAGITNLLTDNPAIFENSGFKVSRVPTAPDTLFLMTRNYPELESKGALPVETSKLTYTSGSTGTPKGVCLSPAHIANVANAIATATQVCDIKRHLCILPLPTLLENIAGIYAPFLRGAEVIIPALTELGFKGSSQFNHSDF